MTRRNFASIRSSSIWHSPALDNVGLRGKHGVNTIGAPHVLLPHCETVHVTSLPGPKFSSGGRTATSSFDDAR